MHLVGKNDRTIGIGLFTKQVAHSGAIKDIIAQHERHRILTNKFLAQDKGLCQSVRGGLYHILKAATELAAVAQERGNVVRAAILRTRAADGGSADGDAAGQAAQQDLDRLVQRLQTALSWSTDTRGEA